MALHRSTGPGSTGAMGGRKERRVSDKHCASWLGLCPGTMITGGKVMSGKSKRCANRAAQALRLAAAALRTSQSALGAHFRRICARMDKPKAITAAAHMANAEHLGEPLETRLRTLSHRRQQDAGTASSPAGQIPIFALLENP